MGLKIHVISFTFPPQSGIGGRRWAKFTKYFSKMGTHVEVFTTPVFTEGSPWMADVPSSVRIHRIKSGFPDVVRFGPKSILDKILYRFQVQRFRSRTQGNYYDHSTFWNKNLLPALERSLNDVDILIATAGPFSYLHDLLKLKESHPNLKLVADFRDPWTNNKTAFGYDTLDLKRFQFEKQKERKVVQGFDLIVSVATPMTEYFKLLETKDQTEKFVTLPNGYDPNDFLKKPIPKMVNTKVTICFVGTLYGKTQATLVSLASAMKGFQDQIQFRFCGDMNAEAYHILRQCENVELMGKVDGKTAKETISQSDICLLLLTDDLTYSFSTKFCEYIQARKPIWIVSNAGSTPDFVRENGIGFHSLPTPDSIKQGLENIRTSLDSISYEGFDDSSFNLESISKQYLERLVHLVKHDNSLK